MVIPILQIILIFSTVVFFVIYYNNYKVYYGYLQSRHHGEFMQLIYKDKIIDSVGKWVRWPVGSAWLLLSIHNLKEDYGDNKIAGYKKRAMIYLIITILLFVLSLLFSLLLTL